MPQPKLLIATGNPGKMREYRDLLRAVPFQLVSLSDMGITDEVEETGVTFHENAALKTSGYAALSGLLTLADDSGLEVDALDGAPGVYSARYGELPSTPTDQFLPGTGQEGKMTDEDRVALLLRNLEGVPWERRTARFRCVIAIGRPNQEGGERTGSDSQAGEEIPPTPLYERGAFSGLTFMVGSVAGMIQYEPVGDEGFGYDPVFYLPSFGQTLAQISLADKNLISHRSDAARKAVAFLTDKLSAITDRPNADI
jgi:XTP/dITP diphosphohydrolase